MSLSATAKVSSIGSEQIIQVPSGFRIAGEQILFRRDSVSGDIILADIPHADATAARRARLDKIFAALEASPLPDDFMADRDTSPSPVREEF